MAQRKVVVRKYNMSDGDLSGHCRMIRMCVQRDILDFMNRGVSEAFIEAFHQQRLDWDSFDEDVVKVGEIMEATEIKDASEEKLRLALRTYRTMVHNKWGINHRNYRVYKFERLHHTTDDILHRLARTVKLVGPRHLADLATEGFTQDMLDNIDQLDIQFELDMDLQQNAQTEREIQTQERIEMGNNLYKEMMRLSNIGKDLYATTNSARYKDYIIYHEPSTKKPKEEKAAQPPKTSKISKKKSS